MDTTFSASSKGKTASGATPFDQIRAAESAESARVQKELDFFSRKQQETVKQMREMEENEERAIREEATQELKEFREKELPKLLSGFDQQAKKMGDALEGAYEKKEKTAVDSLMKTVSDPAFLSLAA